MNDSPTDWCEAQHEAGMHTHCAHTRAHITQLLHEDAAKQGQRGGETPDGKERQTA